MSSEYLNHQLDLQRNKLRQAREMRDMAERIIATAVTDIAVVKRAQFFEVTIENNYRALRSAEHVKLTYKTPQEIDEDIRARHERDMGEQAMWEDAVDDSGAQDHEIED